MPPPLIAQIEEGALRSGKSRERRCYTLCAVRSIAPVTVLVRSLPALVVACATRGAPRPATTAGVSAPPRSLNTTASQTATNSGSSSPTRAASLSRGSPTLPRARPDERWQAYLFEPCRDAVRVRRVGVEADGTYYAIACGLRVRVRGGQYAWSADYVLGGLVTAARTNDGWLFASAEGALFRAPYFTAPLERAGSTDGARIDRHFISTGRIVATDATGALWIGAHDGFRRWTPPDGAALLDAGFVNERFGLSLTSPGKLFRTLDGGARWEPVDLMGRGGFEILPQTEAFVLRSAEGMLRVDASGAAAPFAGLAPNADTSISEASEVLRAASAEGPGARAALLAQQAIALPPDRIYFLNATYRPPHDRFGSYLRTAMYAQDALWLATGSTPPSQVDPPGTQCRYAPWRDRLVAFCRDHTYYRAAIFAGDGVGPWSSITPPANVNMYGGFASSADGRSLWTLATCDNAQRSSNVLWCRYDGSRWANVEVERRASFVASWGDFVVYKLPQGVFEQSVPGPLRVQHVGATPDAARPPRRSDPRARIESGAFTEDGTFFARATIEDTAALAIGAADGELAIRPLPSGARDVAMTDAHRGMAVGDRLDRVWITDDGGVSWRPLALPLRGDPRGVQIPTELGDGEIRVRCSSLGCAINDRLLWASESFVGESPPTVHGTPRAQPYESPEEQTRTSAPRPPAREIEFGTMRCAAMSEERTESRTWYGAGGWLEQRQNHWDWGAADARGAFRATSQGAMPAQEAPPNWNAALLSYAPRFVSRALAIVERCSFNTTYGGASRIRQCDLVALAPNSPPRIWLSPRNVAAPLSMISSPRIAELAPLADGTFGVRIATGPLEEQPNSAESRSELRVDLVLRVDSSGVVREQRSFAWTSREQRLRALGFDGAQLGLVLLRPGLRELRFFRSPSEPDRALGPAPLRLQPCGVEPRPGAPFFVSSANEHNVAIRAGSAFSGTRLLRGEDSIQSVVEVSSSGVCIRRVSAGTNVLASPSNSDSASYFGGALVLEAQAGVLRGYAARPRGRASIDCVPDVATR